MVSIERMIADVERRHSNGSLSDSQRDELVSAYRVGIAGAEAAEIESRFPRTFLTFVASFGLLVAAAFLRHLRFTTERGQSSDS